MARQILGARPRFSKRDLRIAQLILEEPEAQSRGGYIAT